MKTKIFLFTALAMFVLIGCERKNEESAWDKTLWSYYRNITDGIESAYRFEHINLDSMAGAWGMTFGLLSGDSLYIKRTADNCFVLTTDKSARSTLNLKAEFSDHMSYEQGSEIREYFSVLLNGEGNYRFSDDTILSYEWKNIDGVLLYGHQTYPTDIDYSEAAFMYEIGDEIVLTYTANGKKTTYHYTIYGGRVHCSETGTMLQSYDE